MAGIKLIHSAYEALGGLPNDTYAVYPQDPDFKALVIDFARKMNAKGDNVLRPA